MIKGAVFFDYDGTLVDQSQKIYFPTEKTIEATRLLKANDYMVCIATGRSRCYIPKMDINFDCYITTNGTYVSVNGKDIFKSSFDINDIKKAVEYFEENGFIYIIEEQERCFVNSFESPLFKNMIEFFKIDTGAFKIFDGNFEGLEINKMMVMYETKEQILDFSHKFEEKFEVTSHRSIYSSDVNLRGISKADGICAAIKYMDIKLENTYAFGDGENDYDMLNSVGNGIAMGIHSPMLNKLKNLYVTDTVEDEGIFKALKHFKVI